VSAFALRIGDEALTHDELDGLVGGLAAGLPRGRRIAVVAEASLDAALLIMAGLAAGCEVVPLNPKSGTSEREHILADARPELVLETADRGRVEAAPVPAADGGALVIYTSGTTGPPKGVVLPSAALHANLDAVYEAWAWTAADRVAHALPLYHVHGLLLGTLGPLWRGGSSHHVGRFEPHALADALRGGGTMVFGVPTMWSRIAAACDADPDLAGPFRDARLLVSGSAGLPLSQHARLEALFGRRVIERYGMSETLFTVGERAGTTAAPGSVGTPLPGVELRLAGGEDGLGEIELRAPWLFTGYLGQEQATREAFTPDGFFRTGDIALRRDDGMLRIVGRRATDLIKSGGYRIGAGEIESCLLDHPAVAEAAVTGEPDDDLGERIVAWVVLRDDAPPAELAEHVARALAPHKRPREVRVLDALPRNDLGKVLKRELPRG
jgi:acyl-CoA synthetase (AMP-forming)/AMP-acid ligase II